MTQKNSINSRQPATSNDQKIKYISASNDPHINRIIRVHQGELRYCFERYIVYNPEYPERFLAVIDWDTFEEGRIKGIRFVQTIFSIEHDEFHECLVRRVSHWRFPQETKKKYMILSFSRVDPIGP